MAYPCLHFTDNHEGLKTHKRRIQEDSIRRIQFKVKMEDPNITIEEYIRLKEEKARRRGKMYNWETAMYAALSCDAYEEQNILYFNDLFSFNVIYPDDSKSDKDNDDDKIDIDHSSGDLSVKPLPDLINTDVVT
ncbi:hypothetical protein Tco_1222709 [Tanacetum coccineum]